MLWVLCETVKVLVHAARMNLFAHTFFFDLLWLFGSRASQGLVPLLRSHNNLGCGSRSWRRMEQAREVANMESAQGQGPERGHWKGTKRGKDSSFCYADGQLPPRELGDGTKVLKIQQSCCTPSWRGDGRLWFNAVLTERRSAVKRIVVPPQINTVWRPRTTWRYFEQEGRGARRAGFASSTYASLKERGRDQPGAVRGKVGGVCGGARSHRRGFAPTYFSFVTPSDIVQSCDVEGAVTVPGQWRESGVNFFSSGWRGLFVCVSSVIWCAGGGSMVCEKTTRTTMWTWTLFRLPLGWLVDETGSSV